MASVVPRQMTPQVSCEPVFTHDAGTMSCTYTASRAAARGIAITGHGGVLRAIGESITDVPSA